MLSRVRVIYLPLFLLASILYSRIVLIFWLVPVSLLILISSSSSSLNQLGEHRLHDTTPRTNVKTKLVGLDTNRSYLLTA